MSKFELSVLLFLQLAVILAACRTAGWLARRLGQPPVVGEIVAGVVLGPSVFGLVWPSAHLALFPAPSMTVLYAIAQLGLTVYMFLVGIEFRIDLIRSRIGSASAVSITGIAAPFALGVLIARAMHGRADLFGSGVSALEASLFLGAAMSITAFPVLARIVHERGLDGTSLGTLALAAGSIDDAAAWCVLAIVLASMSGDPTIAAWAIGGGVAYAVFVWAAARPWLARLDRWIEARGSTSRTTVLGFVLVLVMLGAWFTDWIGIYSVFGAFVLGAAMPRGTTTEELRQRIYPLTATLLLPLYFVYSGLNTRIGLLSTPALWGLALLVLAAAIVGKGVACFTAARLQGAPPREAAAIGALMNARGLIELVMLNIGYERGIISQTLFSIMVIMAIVTTLMAAPVVEWVYGRERDAHLAASGRALPTD